MPSFTCHKPNMYIAGVLTREEDPYTGEVKEQWIGEFHATSTELLQYALKDGMGELEMLLIDDMIEAALVYEKWWKKVRKNVK